MRCVYLFFAFAILFHSCKSRTETSLFEEVAQSSGIQFANTLTYTEEFNPYTYRNFYNGGGVALADVNNDGLLDVYLTGNIVDNKLFLNKGNWQFEDITQKSGLACSGVWSSGAVFADVNADGLVDVYVCKSGKPEGDNRYNELFINNGDLTFTESAKEYGLDITGLSSHAAFFDYDKDGDLDCYVLTNSIRSIGGFDLIVDQRKIPDPDGGNKFFRNDGGHFTDITIEAGIYSSKIGFGLGITLGDFNGDNWTDLFISNDFFEKDYLYLNDQKGGFTESSDNSFASLSMGSMGADAADLDNDQRPDLMVTEMLPATIERVRTKTVFEPWDKHVLAIQKGYGYQYPRNVLQRNLGDAEFAEVGRYSGVSATEWSWGALIFDMDNDGLKDIFISNGIYKDLLDRDYLAYTANDESVRAIIQSKQDVITQLIDKMPSQAVPNFAYQNLGDFQFTNKADSWGLSQPSFSNGSAYGDLDNDGDLDLVVNNVNMPAFVYRNHTDTAINRSLTVKLVGTGQNTQGVGAEVRAYYGNAVGTVSNFPSRGFESSVTPLVHIGLGNTKIIDSVSVQWQSGAVQVMSNVPSNKLITFVEAEANQETLPVVSPSAQFVPIAQQLNFVHQENDFVDFNRDRLLPQMLHNEGPSIALGDVDRDGKQDMHIAGAKGQPGALMVQTGTGFQPIATDLFNEDAISEDSDNVFIDFDLDGDLDLYVASGGRAFSKSSSALMDRLYENKGNGQWELVQDALPYTTYFSTAVVVSTDLNGDRYPDLFVGERFHPFNYGTEVRGYLLINDQNGHFEDQTNELAPALMHMPMITDAKWVDMNQDNQVDLVVTTEWGPVKIFIQENGLFEDMTSLSGLGQWTGWWNVIETMDIDQDGDLDMLVGNHGKNSFFKDSTRLYYKDFDQNGTIDYIICHRIGNRYFPIADRDELVAQLPGLKKRILYFKDFATMDIEALFTADELQDVVIMDAYCLASSIFTQDNGIYSRKDLPSSLQYAPINVITLHDLDGDQKQDVLFGGNQYLVKPKFGRYDAMPLMYWTNKALMAGQEPAFTNIKGQIMDIQVLDQGTQKWIIVGRNNDKVGIYEYQN